MLSGGGIASISNNEVLLPRKKAEKKVRQMPKQEDDGKWRTVVMASRMECQRNSCRCSLPFSKTKHYRISSIAFLSKGS